MATTSTNSPAWVIPTELNGHPGYVCEFCGRAWYAGNTSHGRYLQEHAECPDRMLADFDYQAPRFLGVEAELADAA